MLTTNLTILLVAAENSSAHIELGENGFYDGAVTLEVQQGLTLHGGVTYSGYTMRKVDNLHYAIVSSEGEHPHHLILSTRRISRAQHGGDGRIYGTSRNEGKYLVLASAAEIDGKGSIDKRRCETRIIELKSDAKAVFRVDFGGELPDCDKSRYYCVVDGKLVLTNSLDSTIQPNLTVGAFIEQLGGLVEI